MLQTVNPKPTLLTKCYLTMDSAVIARKSCQVLKMSKGLDGSVDACCSWLCYSRAGSVAAHSWGSHGAHRIGHSWKSVLVRKALQEELRISIYFSVCLRMALVVFGWVLGMVDIVLSSCGSTYLWLYRSELCLWPQLCLFLWAWVGTEAVV